MFLMIALLFTDAVQAGDVEDADAALKRKYYAPAMRNYKAAALQNTPYAACKYLQRRIGNKARLFRGCALVQVGSRAG
jgi:hypothetical protein